jgi:hypothetical protein
MSLRIGGKIKYAINPLPDVSDSEILKKAGLTKRKPSKHHPFEFSWLVGSGHDKQTFHITPDSEPLALRGDAEWRVFDRQWREWGGVLVNEDDSDEVVANKTFDGLRRAYEAWTKIGQVRVDEYQITHGLTDEQIERQRDQIWRYYYNQALADVISDRMEELNSQE